MRLLKTLKQLYVHVVQVSPSTTLVPLLTLSLLAFALLVQRLVKQLPEVSRQMWTAASSATCAHRREWSPHCSGTIPDALASLTELKTLNLLSNQFTGQLPTAIVERTHIQVGWDDPNTLASQLE